jgi:Kef-type K+ transport system membrane component KefB
LFRHREGKGFTFVLVLALGAGLFAEWIGLHMIIGAYLAGLFFDLEVADPNLIQIVRDRLYGIAYSFLGPIFFISLGFHITFDVFAEYGPWFVLALTGFLIIGQVMSAGGMARRLRLSWTESLTVGVGMCGRAEMAFILASLGLGQGVIGDKVFSVPIFTAFLLNLFTPIALKGCAVLLRRDNVSG